MAVAGAIDSTLISASREVDAVGSPAPPDCASSDCIPFVAEVSATVSAGAESIASAAAGTGGTAVGLIGSMWSKENAGVAPDGPADVAALPFDLGVGLEGREWKGVIENGSLGLPEKTLKTDGSIASGRTAGADAIQHREGEMRTHVPEPPLNPARMLPS